MERFARNLILTLVAVAAASCASSSDPVPGEGANMGRPMGNPDLILRQEIDETLSAQNAMQLIQSVRPQWLITRGIANLRQATGEEDIVVYMDNARLGYREALRRVPLGGVRYLEFFDARRATQRWGSGHLHGAIFISTQER
jgi:hypothetical protein